MTGRISTAHTEGATTALVRLLQLTDSSFPSGSFAYSHGLEWLVHEGLVADETGVGEVLNAYLVQAGGGLWLPGAIAAIRAPTPAVLRRGDAVLDRAIAVPAERAASRAIGERLLAGAGDAFGGEWTLGLAAQVRAGTTPGHHAIAFGAIARDLGAPEATALAAFAFTLASSITQAAIRLGVIGQAGAARVLAARAAVIDETVARALSRPDRVRPGAFTPGLDIAGLLHPILPFKVFAS